MSDIVLYDPNDASVPNRVVAYHRSVNTPDYDAEANKLVNPDLSAVASVPQNYWKYDGAADLVEMDDLEKVLVDGGLAALKATRIIEIDARTEVLITDTGFSHNGQVFSTSANAQSKWHAIQIMNLMGQVTFPLTVSTKDEQSYDISDSAELSTMYALLVGTGKSFHDSGKTLKDAVNAATSKSEVDAVVDNR